VKRRIVLIGIAAVSIAANMLAQNPPAAKTSTKKSSVSGSVSRGKEVFSAKCAVCHNADSDEKKVGPGLKGIAKRGTFSVNGNKLTDESLKTWIENGDALMPPFKDVLTPIQIKDVGTYVKTL
jgi:mono/diheme cytochrome c family protein